LDAWPSSERDKVLAGASWLSQSIAITGAGGQIMSLSMDVEATRGAVVVIFFLFICF